MDARVKMDRMMTAGEGRPEFSVVSPVRNEAENVDTLVREIASALSGRAFEIIFVDRAVRTGVVAARANVIVTLDGDGQNDPADIPGLLGQLNRSDAPMELALIQGRRAKRIDSGWKKMGSRLANNVRRSVLKDANSDSGCGMRAFRRDTYMLLPYFDHMHRYLPALMMSEGLRVEEREVGHRARQHGRSNYTNFGRLAVAVSDMRGVMWLRKRRRSPGGVDEI